MSRAVTVSHPTRLTSKKTGPGTGWGLAHSGRYLALWGQVWCSLNVQ
jgi:hypothetical protein